MLLSAVPIIHARTKDVDFRSQLLVVPIFFSLDDIKRCRTFIAESTRYFEIAGKEGRKVLFSNDDYVVIGVSIAIRNLYELCNKPPQYHLVDGSRTNYAFIGFLFQKKDIKRPFYIPYELYLEEYERIMNERWLDAMGSPNSLLPTKMSFRDVEFPEIETYETDLNLSPHAQKVIYNSTKFSADVVITEIIKNIQRENEISFCSDLPNAVSFIDSHFNIGTSVYSEQIQEQINKTHAQEMRAEAPVNDCPKSKFDKFWFNRKSSKCDRNENTADLDHIEIQIENSELLFPHMSTYQQIKDMMSSAEEIDTTETESHSIVNFAKEIVSSKKKTSKKSKGNDKHINISISHWKRD